MVLKAESVKSESSADGAGKSLLSVSSVSVRARWVAGFVSVRACCCDFREGSKAVGLGAVPITPLAANCARCFCSSSWACSTASVSLPWITNSCPGLTGDRALPTNCISAIRCAGIRLRSASSFCVLSCRAPNTETISKQTTNAAFAMPLARGS